MKKIKMISVLILVLSFCLNPLLKAQDADVKVFEPIKLGGPRFGVTYLTGESARVLEERFDMYPVITQFGWQVETRFFTLDNGASGVAELVGLVGGMEQGKILPSANFLMGYRTPNGFEFGVGPNLSLSGLSFVFAVGATIKGDYVNVPLNLAITTSDDGVRLSLLVGMTFSGKVKFF